MAKEYDEIDLGEWRGATMTIEKMTFDDKIYTLTSPKDVRTGDYLILVGTLIDDEVVELTLWIEPRPEEIKLLGETS